MKYSAKATSKSLLQVKLQLEQIPKKLVNKTLRAALKEWGSMVVTAIKAGVTWNAPKTRRAAALKIKTYKRGKVMWMGIGIRTDLGHPGRLAHLYNEGFRPYPKGRPSGVTGKGKGWRKNLKGVGGNVIYQTGFITNAKEKLQNRLIPIISQHINRVIKEISP